VNNSSDDHIPFPALDDSPEQLPDVEPVGLVEENAQYDATRAFSDALWQAYNRLNEIREKERLLTVQKAQLKQTINALYPLVFPNIPDVNALSLADAIRMVIHSDGRGMNAREIRHKLDDIGYDLSKHENALASIHTAVKRMVDAEELIWVDADGKKVGAGPELKNVPEPSPVDAMESLALKIKNEVEGQK